MHPSSHRMTGLVLLMTVTFGLNTVGAASNSSVAAFSPDSSLHGIGSKQPPIESTAFPLDTNAHKTSAQVGQHVGVGEVPEHLTVADWSSIQGHIDAHRRVVTASKMGWQAFNPSQQWNIRFDGRGFQASPQAGGWNWGLALQGFGRDDNSIRQVTKPTVHATGSKLSYAWSGGLEEWYVNDRQGLEHGYTVNSKPQGHGPLQLQLETLGGLKPRVGSNGQDVAFVDTRGATILNYNQLKVVDADGKALKAGFSAQGGHLKLAVDDQGARYPLTIDPIAQQAYLKASNTGANDYFGYSVAMDGDTAVVGAPYEASKATGVNGLQTDNSSASSGAVYVFVRSAGVWAPQAYLKASNTGASDNFGNSVAISGDTVVVGARNEASKATGVNASATLQADNSSTLSGAAYVFVRNSGVWSQQAYLKASNTGASDNFGWSVAVSGDTAVVGATGEDSKATGVNANTLQTDNSALNSGAAYVFVRSGTTWSQQAYLKASNTGVSDSFGYSVAASGNTVVIGALYEASKATGVNANTTLQADNTALNSGAAYVFVRSGTTWSQQAYLKASNTGAGDYFGNSVAVSGDTAIVGARSEASNATGVNGPDNNLALNSGAAYVFFRNGSTWTQQAYLKASNTGASDYFGISVALSGDMAVVGAYGEASKNGVETDNTAAYAGAAYVFTRTGTSWSQLAYLKAAFPDAADYFGNSVAVSSSLVIASAYGEDSNAINVGGDQSSNTASLSGAAYAFTFRTPSVTTLSSDLNPASYSQSVTLTATVAPSTATGSVTFKEGSTDLGTSALSGGVATYINNSLIGGSHSITAVYTGDTTYMDSTSNTVTQTINRASTTTTVSSSSAANTSNYKDSVTFTATVSPSATGSVTFKDGGTSLGAAATLNGSSQATLTTSTLTGGSHAITADYGGNAGYDISSSSGLTQTVNKINPTVNTWPTVASPITYGQMLVSASLSGSSAVQTGNFGFTTPTTKPDVGTASHSVTFTPTGTDALNYNTLDGTASVTVDMATPSVTNCAAITATYNQILTDADLTSCIATNPNDSTAIVGSFTFTGSAPTTSTLGTSNPSVSFTPTGTDATRYNLLGTGSVSLTVTQATPTVTTWPTASLTYGQALSSAIFAGDVATPTGSFSYDSPATVPTMADSGSSPAATYTPSDKTNYTTVSGTVLLTVSKAVPTASCAITAFYGQTLADGMLTSCTAVNPYDGTLSATGIFALVSSTYVAGVDTPAVSFTPDTGSAVSYDSTNSGTVTMTVNKTSPAVLCNPITVTIGQTLADSMLTGACTATNPYSGATAAGTFAFFNHGTVSSSSTQFVSFTPTDTTNYSGNNSSVSVTAVP